MQERLVKLQKDGSRERSVLVPRGHGIYSVERVKVPPPLNLGRVRPMTLSNNQFTKWVWRVFLGIVLLFIPVALTCDIDCFAHKRSQDEGERNGR